MASKQGQQLTTILDQNLLNFVGVDNFNLHHLVGQRFPEVGDGHVVAHMELFNVTKIAGTGITTVASYNAVCVGTSDGKTRLT